MGWRVREPRATAGDSLQYWLDGSGAGVSMHWRRTASAMRHPIHHEKRLSWRQNSGRPRALGLGGA